MNQQDATGKAPGSDGSSTYRQILHSSALVGLSAAFNIAVGLVRTKALAVLLGPAGFGLMGALNSLLDLARSLAGMGISSSGVRQIAESAASNDSQRIARTVAVLRRTAIALGVLGAVVLVAFSRPIALLTFGDDTQAVGVALLALALFFRLVADAQGALLQGMRRIADYAKVSAAGALLGTLAAIALVYWLGVDGVAPAVVAIAAMSALASWWYCRKVEIQAPALTRAELRSEAGALLKLGLAFMMSSFLMMSAAYVVRLLLIRHEGLEAAGLYQAAWTIGGLYIGFVLQAMGADFYPRLVAAVADRARVNQLVNEQAHVSLLLAATGVIATITAAPWVLSLLYSSEFVAAERALRWICLGMMLRVVSWPMGFIIIAKAQQIVFFATELAWTVLCVGLSWLLVPLLGIVGAAVAFTAAYVCHAVMVYCIVSGQHGFAWSGYNARAIGVCLLLVLTVFVSFSVLALSVALFIGAVSTLLMLTYTVRCLSLLTNPAALPKPLRVLLRTESAPSAAK